MKLGDADAGAASEREEAAHLGEPLDRPENFALVIGQMADDHVTETEFTKGG